MLHFAYGSNMDRAAMTARCPEARAVGPAMLPGWRFFIGVDGWGSIDPAPGSTVHGVLWTLTPRDCAALHAYELMHKGLYGMRTLPVRFGPRRLPAMTYVLRRRIPGIPRPGYIGLIVRAARGWDLPERYIVSLGRPAPSGWAGKRDARTGGVSWEARALSAT